MHRALTHPHRASCSAPVAILAALVVLGGCDRSRPVTADPRPHVVATTTMLGDMVRVLAGDDFVVEAIMRPGADPHLYRPTPADARRVAASDLVVVSGLHLEGWAEDLIANAGGERPVVTASDGVDVIRMEGFAGGVDPHFWFDTRAWDVATHAVAAALVAAAPDEATAARVHARREHYSQVLGELDAWVRASLSTIPESHGVMVTSHDAFNYFARAYGLRVAGIQGISTEAEASQRDVANIVQLVRETGAPAVFAETSVNPALIERVATETGARIAGPLYSDSIGPADGPAGTYVGMVAENVRMITEALGGSVEPFEAP